MQDLSLDEFSGINGGRSNSTASKEEAVATVGAAIAGGAGVVLAIAAAPEFLAAASIAYAGFGAVMLGTAAYIEYERSIGR